MGAGHVGRYRAKIGLEHLAGCKSAVCAEPAPNYAPAKADAFIAVNDPERLAWQLSCAISAPAENAHPRDVTWETWPEQSEICADAFVAPQWQSAGFRGKRLRPSAQHFARRVARAGNALVEMHSLSKPRDGVSNEEFRDNKSAFDYIVKNQLWYKEGIAEKVRDGALEFAPGSIAIKGKWEVITEEHKARFHWHEHIDPMTGKPVTVGSVALNIAAKIVPNWHWSTFEHVDNPGLADYIGVHDILGI